MAWEGGFLDGQAVHFNENLNSLVGGRGSGKSTLIESIRYALDLEPLGSEARKSHEGIVKDVLKSGTRIYLLVRSTRPADRCYRIERIVPNPPTVRDRDGEEVLPFHPRDILPGVEVYGQHEISELTKSREKLTRLLDRFIQRDPALKPRKAESEKELARSRNQLLEVRKEIRAIDDRLGRLPGLQETLKRYQDVGLEDRLKDQSLVVREERVLKTAVERASRFDGLLEQLRRETPLTTPFSRPRPLLTCQAVRFWHRRMSPSSFWRPLFATLRIKWSKPCIRPRARSQESRRGGGRKLGVQKEYEKILRELQRSNVDGEEFIRLRRQIEDLQPLQERRVSSCGNWKRFARAGANCSQNGRMRKAPSSRSCNVPRSGLRRRSRAM